MPPAGSAGLDRVRVDRITTEKNKRGYPQKNFFRNKKGGIVMDEHRKSQKSKNATNGNAFDKKDIELAYKFKWERRTEYALTTEQKASFYTMERKAEVYAQSFYGVLAEIVQKKENCEKEDHILPLVFLPFDEKKEQHKKEYGDKARKRDNEIEHGCFIRTHLDGSEDIQIATIQIALPIRRKNTNLPESLKKVIRHELIHFFLFFHNLPHSDNDALFHAYCKIYDAEAYMQLRDEEQRRFILFEEYLKDQKERFNLPLYLQALLADAVIMNEDKYITDYCRIRAAFLKEKHRRISVYNSWINRIRDI